MATDEEETTPTKERLMHDALFGGPAPSLLREQGATDCRARKPRLSRDPSYVRGYELARWGLPDLDSFIRSAAPKIPGYRLSRECMSFLMRKQYGGKRPALCPCYDAL